MFALRLFAHSPRTGLGSNSTWAPLASNNAKTNECLEALLVFSPRCVRVCVCLRSLCSTCRQWVIFSRQFSDQELRCLIWLASCCRLPMRGNMLPSQRSHIQVVCSQNKTKQRHWPWALFECKLWRSLRSHICMTGSSLRFSGVTHATLHKTGLGQR